MQSYHLDTMGIVLFHLQFYRLGMGMLFCFCAETPLGKPRIYVRPMLPIYGFGALAV